MDTSTVSEWIPSELIKPRKYWHSSGSHIVNVVNVSFVNEELIPLTFRKLMCFSMGKEGHEGSSSRGGVPACGGCGLTYSWFGYFCVGCGEFFIRDFHHPKFCPLFPTCWNCTPELPWDYCPDHHVRSVGSLEIVPPVGVNPKKYSQEEIDDVFGPGFFD